MGMIYKARQPQLNRIVALKILSPDLSGDPAFAERFSREAQSLARLNHSNIVAIYDFGRVAGFYYLLMEFIDGANLHTLIQSKQLSPNESRRIALEICQALQYAHEEGVIHRDIKPSNILLDKKGRVKIADFGLAKLTAQDGQGSARPALTTTVMGTPHYIAPEQVETPALVDHRADLYSLGVVFYEMLTGQLPLGRFALPSQRSQAIDVRLDEVVLHALEKEPGRRYQHASEIRADLETVTGKLQLAPGGPVGVLKKPRNWSFVRQFSLMAGTALLAVFFYLLLKNHWPGRQSVPIPASTQAVSNAAPEIPLVGRRFLVPLHLTRDQAADVTRIVRRYQREFVVLEHRHTEHTRDDAGHVHITIQPFPDDMQRLMTRMKKELDGVLTAEQAAIAQTLDLEKLLPNTGRNLVHVEIWRDPNGEEHYVESANPGPNATGSAPGASPKPMPPRYRSYLLESQ